jgi:hypothetical protein
MNHAIEFFHTLVEHEFRPDQYEVSFNDGKYHVKIVIPFELDERTYYAYLMNEKRMKRCLKGMLKPENLVLVTQHPIWLRDDITIERKWV